MPREKKPVNQNLTIPNAMSVLRILIVPVFAWLFIRGELIWSVVCLVLSALTDLFDGIIARKLDQVTELGKMLDPLADKLTQCVVAFCLAVSYPSICPVLIIFITKEVLMLCCASVLLKKKKRPGAAKWYGKVSTVLFYITVSAIVFMDGFLNMSGTVFNAISYCLLIITAVMMIYAAYRYFRIFLEILHSDDEKYELDLPDEIRAKTIRNKAADD